MQKCKDQLKELRVVARQLAKVATDHEEQTKALGERVDTQRSVGSIETEIAKIEQKLSEEAER